MDLTALNTSLSTLGTVDLLVEVEGKLFVCVKEFTSSLENISNLNTIISNEIAATYPIIETLSLEGGSVKAIFLVD